MKHTLLVALAISLLFACKKETIEVKAPSETICLVDSINTDGSTQKIYYDNQNRFVKGVYFSEGDTAIQNATYEGNTVTITVDGEPTSQTIYLNKNGFSDSILIDFGDELLTIKFTYNQLNQHIKSVLVGEVMGFNFNQTTTYEWLNGNIVKETTESEDETTVVQYQYDASKVNGLKSHEERMGLLPSNANLKTKIIFDDGSETLYTYEFNSKNQLVKVLENSNGETVISDYFWLCK